MKNIDFTHHFDTKMKFVGGGAHSEIERFRKEVHPKNDQKRTSRDIGVLAMSQKIELK